MPKDDILAKVMTIRRDISLTWAADKSRCLKRSVTLSKGMVVVEKLEFQLHLKEFKPKTFHNGDQAHIPRLLYPN